MTDDEAKKAYRAVASMLIAAGFRWIVEEVEDAAAEGVPEEVIPEVAEHQAVRRVAAIWPELERGQGTAQPRRRTQRRFRYRNPTALERLESLRQAIKAVFLDADKMVNVVTHELGVTSSAISFLPDLTGADAEFSRAKISGFSMQALSLTAQQRKQLQALLHELSEGSRDADLQ